MLVELPLESFETSWRPSTAQLDHIPGSLSRLPLQASHTLKRLIISGSTLEVKIFLRQILPKLQYLDVSKSGIIAEELKLVCMQMPD